MYIACIPLFSLKISQRRKSLRSLDSLFFLLIKSTAEFALNRTPKYFRTKKYKYLERPTVKGKPKSVLQSKF